MKTIAATLALTLTASIAWAAEHEIRMLNRGATGTMVFEPDFIAVAPGDSVKFIATDRGHNAASIDGLMPEGATSFRGGINEEIVVKLEKEGLYGVKCTPHYAMGMVALIQVGPKPTAPSLPSALPAAVKTKLQSLLTRVK